MASWHAAVLKFSGSYRILLYDAPGQARGSILSGSAAVNIDEQVEVLRGLIHAVLGTQELFTWWGLLGSCHCGDLRREIS